MPLHILVVEDDDLVRPLTVEIVSLLGFEVASCSCAAEALHLLAMPPLPALVITDVQMPGAMDGIGLAHTIAARWPALLIIVTSGVAVPIMSLPSGAKFLPKPASIAAFDELLRELLNRGQAAV